jgi:aspartate aminotransferase-like enzyme
MGLDVALGLLEAEGLPEVYRRHDRLARAARAGAEALGLALFARATPSPAVTAIEAPAGVDGEAIVRAYGEQQNLTIAGGQGQMKGKIFRLAHLGYVDEGDLLVGLAALERILLGLGLAVELGAALGAAQKVFTKDA